MSTLSTTKPSSQSDVQNMDGINPDDIYQALGFIGQGVWGKVTKCLKKETGEIVAVKTLNNTKDVEWAIMRELGMIYAIRSLDPDTNNIVKFFQYFKSWDGLNFMEFEMLDLSVWDLMKKRRIPFTLNEIRPMAKQLLVALEGLRKVGVMHTDIKPDNIMLVDHQNQPFKVKLIDFGLAMYTSEAEIGMRIQPLIFRAPEVTLGLPLSEAVDMWSLGCCLMEWYIPFNPFLGFSPYDHLQKIIHLIGVPDNDLLQQAAFANEYFIEEGLGWRLKTPFEYEYTNGVKPEISECLNLAKDLEDVITKFYVIESILEFEDRLAFLDLLKKMFHLNPEKRITPTEALQHPFITREHLTSNLGYIELSKRLLTYTPTQAAPTDLHMGFNERSPGQVLTSSSSVTPESSIEDTSFGSSSASFSGSSKNTTTSNSFGIDGNDNPDNIYETLGLIKKVVNGKVTKCLNKLTGEIVTVKSRRITMNMRYMIQKELAMLKAIGALDPDANNIIKFFQHFKSRDGRFHCMEFETLDLSVKNLMRKQKSFSLNEIRPMAKQLLVALEGLRKVGVMHTDIKPDNIMLVDHQNQPFKVKLIDFGLAMCTSEAEIGTRMQPLAYRAPEVTLGLPLSEAVDMWSLGCCLMEWYINEKPLKGFSPYDHLKKIIILLGVPDNDLLQQAAFADEFFIEEGLGWRLKTPFEYEHTEGIEPEMSVYRVDNLEGIITNFYEMKSGLEFEDRLAFLDLLKKVFHLNPEKRITPNEALKHPFITREHLTPTQAASTDLRIGQTPEISSRKSNEPPSATSEKVNEDSARPDCKPKNQCIIGPITVQNDEGPLPPSVEHGAASQEPNQDTNNEEQPDTGTSNASDTAALRPIRPLSEDSKPHQNVPCRVVTTKIQIKYQQSGTFRRRTTRIATKRCQ